MTTPVARLLMPALRWQPDSRYQHESRRIDEALALGVGGFIVFGGPAGEAAELVSSLHARAGRPLLIGADLERGAGQQFPGLEELPPPGALGSLDDLDAVRAAGAATARDALSVGVNWVFAPVADLDRAPENPIVQTRAFGNDSAWVAACVAAWVQGCQGAGALACVKHFPGHGRTTTDSHAGLPLVSAGRTELDDDLRPFRAGVRAGVASCMTAHVAYPVLDPARLPATLSPAILGLLRTELGFEGAVVSDALIMEGAFTGRSESETYVQAIAAGVDVLLYPKDLAAAHAALIGAMRTGALMPARVSQALGRIDGLVASQAALVAEADAAVPAHVGDGLADRLLAAPLLRGTRPVLRPPLEIAMVDDDVGGPYAASPADWVIHALEAAGMALGHGGSRVVLAYAEPRAWKGRAGFSAENRARLEGTVPGADLLVLFGHPRLATDLPGTAPMLVAWHRQRLMQDAVARWLISLLRR